jgi:uncharacterized protein YkwD
MFPHTMINFLAKAKEKNWLILLPFSLFFLTFLGGCVFILEDRQLPLQTSPPTPVSPTQNSQNQPNSTNINSSQFANMEKSIHEQVNQYRASQNLPALKFDPTISQVAREHSQAMAKGSVPFSHQGFEKRVSDISQTISYQSAAENLATNFGYSQPAEQAVQGWINSPGHQKNMVGDFNLSGVGIVQNQKGEYYFTQIFIKRR